MYNSAVSTVGNIRFAAVTDNVGTEIQFYTRPAAGSLTQTMTLDSAGRLGIGTTSPGSFNSSANNLVVGTGAGNEGITIYAATDGQSRIDFKDSADTSETGIIYYNHASDAMMVHTAGGERARIDSSGRLLVGTSTETSTGARLVVAANTVFTSGTNSFGLFRIATKSTVSNSEEPLGSIEFSQDNSSGNGATISATRDNGTWTSGASMPGRLVFSTTADGGSSPTERMRITSTGQVRLAGAGITFNGDTATANELDDYEEGTWTPNITSSGGGSGSGWDNGGRYTKIGRMVYITGHHVLTNKTGINAGSVRIEGLPFTSSVSDVAGVSFHTINSLVQTGIMTVGGVDTNYIVVNNIISSHTQTALTVSELTNVTGFYFSAVYSI
jgi:hypothetical protein